MSVYPFIHFGTPPSIPTVSTSVGNISNSSTKFLMWRPLVPGTDKIRGTWVETS